MSSLDENYILFKVKDFDCALNNRNVQEIIRNNKNITAVKQAPDYINGVINLRGQIVTVINLAVLFELEGDSPSSDRTVIIVNYEDEVFGFLISEVIDILSESNSNIEYSSVLPQDQRKEYVKSVLSIDGHLYSQLNIENVVNLETA